MASPKSTADRAKSIYRQLRSLRRRFRLSGWLTLIVGGLLLILVASYFTYGYTQISDLRDPELILGAAESVIDQQIPAARQRIESEISNNAPEWAQKASDLIVENIPKAREGIEQAALEEIDKGIAKLDVLGDEQFRKILNQNRSAMQDAIKKMKLEEGVSDDVVEMLQEAIEQELEVAAEHQAAAILTMLADLNKNMQTLHKGENLSVEQQAERRLLTLARKMHLVHLSGMNISDLTDGIDPINEAAELMVEAAESQKAKDAEKEAPAVAAPPKEEEKPAAPPEEKEAAPAKEEPKEEPKPEEKAEEPKEDVAAPAEEEKAEEAKPEEKAEEAKPEEKAEEAKPEEKTAPAEEEKVEAPKEEPKPVEQPEEKKDAPAEEPKAEEPAKEGE